MKKLLFIFGSIIVGMLLLVNSVAFNFYSAFQKISKEAVKNGDYDSAERFFSYVYDEGKFYKGPITSDSSEAYLEVYSAINDKANIVLDKDGKETDQVYYTKESAIQFSLFNLPKDFELTNAEGKEGGVELIYSNNSSSTNLFFPFAANKNTKAYQYVEYFSFLPLSIFYSDYQKELTENGISSDAKITNANIIDGSGEVKFSVDFVNSPTFNTNLHNDYFELLTKYNEYQNNEEKQKEEEAEYKKLQEDIIAVNEDGKYIGQHSVNTIYRSSKFIWSMVLVVVIFLALDGLLGFFIFRPKKYGNFRNVKPANPKTTIKPAEPQPFSRKDFIDVKEESAEVEESVNKAEPKDIQNKTESNEQK